MRAPTRDHRSRLALLLLALASLLLGGLVAGPSAGAAGTVANKLTITSIVSPSITVPQTAGTPSVYVVKGVAFDVAVSFSNGGSPAPISDNKVATLKLTVNNGPDAGKTIGSVDVQPGETSKTIPGATLANAANGVTLRVSASIRNKAVDGLGPVDSDPFDSLKAFVSAGADSQLTSIGGGGGVGLGCQPTKTDPICAELNLPDSSGVTTTQLLSLGSCDGLGCAFGDSAIQALVGTNSVYTKANPFWIVVKCDKSQCGGKGVNTYHLTVQLAPTDTPALAPACEAKGVIQSSAEFCVDYRQSTRDNSGDTHLYLLLYRDARTWGT